MILVDPRIGKKNGQTSAERLNTIVTTLRSRVNCKVRGAKPQLNSGDFAFEGCGPDGTMTVGIEWKTVQDAVSSMRSDRLAGDQLAKMSEDYGMAFVIIQGLWRPSANGTLMGLYGREWKPLTLAAKAFQYSELFKYIVSMSVKKNIIVLRSMTEDETLWMIALLYQWWQTPWDQHRSMDPIKLQAEVVYYKVSLLRKMAAELPGIGWTRSLAVEKAFGSVHQMVLASEDQWKAIDGIGPKTASTIHKLVREFAK